MECDIKCLECGKGTMKFELGALVYEARNSSLILVKDPIICPKCKKDISNRKCAVKLQDIMGKIIAANILDEIPSHLQGSFPLSNADFRKARLFCKATLHVIGRD